MKSSPPCRLTAVIVSLLMMVISHNLLATTPPSAQTSITREDILNTTDLTNGVKQAVAAGNLDSITQWQQKAADVANALGLPQSDIDYLQSAYIKNYLIFNAKRLLFNDAIEHAYYSLESIAPIKQRYPEAKDLFPQADKLFAQRDQLIQQIATELAKGQPLTNEIMQQAKAQFKSQMGHVPH